MSPIVQAALSVCGAVGLAVVWLYFFGEDNGTGSRLQDDTRTAVAVAPDRTLPPSAAIPEPPVAVRGAPEGAVSPGRAARTPLAVAARADSSTGNESPTFAEAARYAEQDAAAASGQGDASETPDMPLGDLVISGRVLTRGGAPVAGIELTATTGHLVDRDKGELVPVRGYHRQTASAYDGSYEFRQLADGEYHLRTTETDQYASAGLAVRAGVDFADVVLTGHRVLRVHGIVSTASGEPLPGVQVQTMIRGGGEAALTQNDGRYALAARVREGKRKVAVRASKDGYQDNKVSVKTAQFDTGDGVELNIVMEPETAPAVAVVAGTVRGSAGGPVAGQRLQLSSGKTRQSYRAVTDKNGGFSIHGVEVSDDYMLAIDAVAGYEDYFRRNLRVTEDGLTLAVELKAKDIGTLRGRMVDIYGNPIANVSLVLKTKRTSYDHMRIVGDAVGAFAVPSAPAGELRLTTTSNPYHHIEGIRLTKGAERHVLVVLDYGYGEIRGRAVDERGYPLAVPRISLTWSHAQNGVRSTSRRTTAANEQGDFRFTQLGPGTHTININVRGYKPVRFGHDAAAQGSDIVVRLEKR